MKGKISRNRQYPGVVGPSWRRYRNKCPICNSIWQPREWPSQWTLSMIITFPEKCGLHQRKKTIAPSACGETSPIKASKVIMMVLFNRLKPQATTIIVEEQTGVRLESGTAEKIFNLRKLCERYLLWAFITLRQTWSGTSTVATSAVYRNGGIEDCFRTTVGVREGCLLSPTRFCLLSATSFWKELCLTHWKITQRTASIDGRTITNSRSAIDIDRVVE